MPPKKQQQPQQVYKPCYILPIFLPLNQNIQPSSNTKSSSKQPAESLSALMQPVAIKKNIDLPKIIQLYRDRGLEQYIKNGEVTKQGRQFICKNLKSITQQLISSLSKPPDPKSKAPAKKDPKSKQPQPQPTTPNIDLPAFEKNCTQFLVYLSIPRTAHQLEIFLETEPRIDIVTVVKEKVLPGSRKFKYQLLGVGRTVNEVGDMLKNTSAVSTGKQENNTIQDAVDIINYAEQSAKMIELIKQYRARLPDANPSKSLIIIQTPYFRSLSQKSQSNPSPQAISFLQSYFQRTCKCTQQQQQYQKWRSTRKLAPMIPLIKEIVKKQVLVQQKNQKGKKGGKAQPTYETVEQVVEKRYEDEEGNAKSDLKDYYRIKSIKGNRSITKCNESVYKNIFQTCLQCFGQGQPVSSSPQYKNAVQSLAKTLQLQHSLRPLTVPTTSSLLLSLEQGQRQVSYYRNISMDYPNILAYEYDRLKQKDGDSQFSYMELLQKQIGKVGNNATGGNNNSQQVQAIKHQLKMEYILNKFQQLGKLNNPRKTWDFSNRYFVQHLTKQQIQSLISSQLLLSPQVMTASLPTESLKLIILCRNNPPGRVLYHNTIMPWKVLPDFQNWTDHFLSSVSSTSSHNPENIKIEQFLDYPFTLAGNLSIKSKYMMPTDNAIIKDEMYSIGENRQNIVIVQKNNSLFGLTSKVIGKGKAKEGKINKGFRIYGYWHEIGDEYRIRVMKDKINIEGEVDPSSKNGDRDPQFSKITNISYNLLTTLQYKNRYQVSFDPTPTIYWHQNSSSSKTHSIYKYYQPNNEKMRKFTEDGEVVSYGQDGSISIYRYNGDVSIFRNGKWERIRANKLITGLLEQGTELPITTISEGQQIIKIREYDQTIFTTQSPHQSNSRLSSSPSYKKSVNRTIFQNGTQYEITYLHSLAEPQPILHKLEIKNPCGPFVRIWMGMRAKKNDKKLNKQDSSKQTSDKKEVKDIKDNQQQKGFNVIGHGSAFAYLGFKDLKQRSYDGYIFQFIDFQISTYFYRQCNEKTINQNNSSKKVRCLDNIRLIYYKDGTTIKITEPMASSSSPSQSGSIATQPCRITTLTPNPTILPTQQTLHENWLQLFTTKQQHGEGVFDIDLEKGWVENCDRQTNHFVAKVDGKSQTQIAVSFVSQEEEDSSNFPNGFHIKQQNYFLPPPSNSIPARIFTINKDGTGTEYLSLSQVSLSQSFSPSQTVTSQPISANHKILQYSQQKLPPSALTPFYKVTFSQIPNLQKFSLPNILRDLKTDYGYKEDLVPIKFPSIQLRVLEEIRWDQQSENGLNKQKYANVSRLQEQLRREKQDKKMRKQRRKEQKQHKSVNNNGVNNGNKNQDPLAS